MFQTARSRLGVLLLGTWLLLGAVVPAHAATPSQMAAALQSRAWYEDFGSFGSQVFGRVYRFGPQQTQTPGWYIGSYVTFKGVAGSTVLPMAWQPITDGVILDFGFRREVIRFTGYYAQYEALRFWASDGRQGWWTSTRSPYTPLSVRRLYYQ